MSRKCRPKHLLLGPAYNLAVFWIDLEESPVAGIDDGDSHRRAIVNRAETLFAFFEQRRCAFVLGDISNDDRDPVDSCRTLHGQTGNREISFTTSRIGIVRLVIDDLAAEGLVQIFPGRLFIDVNVQEFRDMASNYLFPCQFPAAQERLVCEHVAMIAVHHNNHFVECFQHSFVFLEPVIAHLALGDVA